MEFEVSYTLDNEQQFWDELDEIISADCRNEEHIDNALRLYLRFTSNYREEYLNSEYDVARCSCSLLDSPLFKEHKDYVRKQMVHSLLQEDCGNSLHLITSFLLFDGRQNEETLLLMNREGAFPRLVDLIQGRQDDDGLLHRRLFELLYEMCRIQKLQPEDLDIIDDDFVAYLFQIIEELSDDVNDPYHYPVIRVLLVLNEQYMVCGHESGRNGPPAGPVTNRVIKVLSLRGSAYKTFGENIILLLNRESETSLQLLILKLLYLLFTTRSTYEYFYTNDLRVLVDVMIRNLLDLPDDSESLRHTYLRVLSPLLSHTQLRHPPHYKREEILKLLNMLCRARTAHFAPLDDTTIRLVGRCMKVPWLKEQGSPAQRGLGISLSPAAGSSVSLLEVSELSGKPGGGTASRRGCQRSYQGRTEDNGVRINEEGVGSPTQGGIPNGTASGLTNRNE